MAKEKVLIYENKEKGKYEIRFKKDFDYGVLFSAPIRDQIGLPAVIVIAHEINNLHDDVSTKVIRQMCAVNKEKEIPEGFKPEDISIFPRIVSNKEEFNNDTTNI